MFLLVYDGLCVLVAFGICFCFMSRPLAPRHALKIYLHVRLPFWARFVCHMVRVDAVYVRLLFGLDFSREIDQVVTGHYTPCTFLVLFFCFVSPRLCRCPFCRASFFPGFLSGCHSGPRALFGFSRNAGGLSSLAPSEALSLGREAAGVFLVFPSLSFLFSLSVVFAASHTLLTPE